MTEWPDGYTDMLTNSSVHTVTTSEESRAWAAQWKFVPAKYGVFVNGLTKPYRIYVVRRSDNHMRDVTDLLPRLCR